LQSFKCFNSFLCKSGHLHNRAYITCGNPFLPATYKSDTVDQLPTLFGDIEY